MEDNGDTFIEANLAAVLNKIKKGAHAHNSAQEYAIVLMRQLDSKGAGIVQWKQFFDGLSK